MSMIANYMRISSEQLQSILAEPSTIVNFLYPADPANFPEECHLDIDKSWSTMHFLFTGSTFEGEGVMANVVLGGKQIGNDEDHDVGYGAAHYLTFQEVKEVYTAIDSLSIEDLWSRLDLEAAAKADIYAFDLEDLESEKDYVINYFERLKDFYSLALKHNQAVIKYIN